MHYAQIFNLGRPKEECTYLYMFQMMFRWKHFAASLWGCTGAWPSCSVIIRPINQKKKTETLALKCYFSGLWGLRQQAEANVETFGLYILCEMCKIRLYQLFIITFNDYRFNQLL